MTPAYFRRLSDGTWGVMVMVEYPDYDFESEFGFDPILWPGTEIRVRKRDQTTTQVTVLDRIDVITATVRGATAPTTWEIYRVA